MNKVICPYCNRAAKRVTGRTIYPNRPGFHNKKFWVCRACNAYVGCHSNGKPFGTLANSDLRILRIKVHKKFDRLWKRGHITRTEAYKLLAEKLNISMKRCHIGMFDTEHCMRAIKVIRKINKKLNMPNSFPVTDPNLDAPDSSIVDGYERHGSTWEKINN